MAFYFPLVQESEAYAKKSKTVYDCNRCKLCDDKRLKNPKVTAVVGKQYDGLVILAEKPTREEDIRGIPLHNDAYSDIRSIGLRQGMNLSKHAAIVYALQCHTGKPKIDTQLKCCRSRMMEQLQELRPKMIICLGANAFKSLFNNKRKFAISTLRNRVIPHHELECLVFPIYNPNEVKSGAFRFALKEDFRRVLKLYEQSFSKRRIVQRVLSDRKILLNSQIIDISRYSIAQIKDIFDKLNQVPHFALDYETTNLYPYDDYFKVRYMGFGLSKLAWCIHIPTFIAEHGPLAWPWFKRQLASLLLNPKVMKVIQNAKFEDLCSRFILGIEEIKNLFCTMIATHTVDERGGCTSLDFQNMVRFGIPPYNEITKKYLETKAEGYEDEDGEFVAKVNRIDEAPYDAMIQYQGLDVLTTFHNHRILDNVLLNDPRYPKARENYNFLMEGMWVLTNMTQRGVMIGEDALNELASRLDEEIADLEARIFAIPEVQQYIEYLNSSNTTLDSKEEEDNVPKLLAKGKKKKAVIATEEIEYKEVHKLTLNIAKPAEPKRRKLTL